MGVVVGSLCSILVTLIPQVLIAGIQFYELDQILTSPCINGTPIPDGTVIRIYRDVDLDGPDTEDPLAPVGGGLGQWNFNTFPFNGCSDLEQCGQFATLVGWNCNGAIVDPRVYYLRTCYLPAQLASDTFSVYSICCQEVELDWTCTTGPCASGPNVRVLSPNGGEVWRIGTPDTLRWVTQNVSGPLRVEVNRSYPSGAWEVLFDSTPDDGFEPLAVPGPPGEPCRVRITTADELFSDVSDGDFQIVPVFGFLALVRASDLNTPILEWDGGTAECPESVSEGFRLKNFGNEPIVVYQPLEPVSEEFRRATGCPGVFVLAPDQHTACSVLLTYEPSLNGVHRDTLLIQSDAANAENFFVRIPLSGERISTPQTPQVVISAVGPDAHLHWNRITESINECPVSVTRYLVFFAGDAIGPYWFLAAPTDTFYVHEDVVTYSEGMFYEVMAITGGAAIAGFAGMQKEAVLEALK